MGTRMLPRGTPDTTGSGSDNSEFMRTTCRLSERELVNQATIDSEIPISSSLLSKIP